MVTGLVTNTVMHPCGNLVVGGVTPIEFMDTCMDTSLARVCVRHLRNPQVSGEDTSLARVCVLVPEQAASRARVLF